METVFYKPECGQWEFTFFPGLFLARDDEGFSIMFAWLFWAVEICFEREE